MLAAIRRIYQDENAFRATIILSIVACFCSVLLSYVSGVLWPFVAAICLAALLNPVIRKMQRLGIRRGLGAFIVLSLLVMGLLVIGVITSFCLQRYFTTYTNTIRSSLAFIARWVPHALNVLATSFHWPGAIDEVRIQSYLMNSLGSLTELLLHNMLMLVHTAKSMVGTFSFLFFVPILTFYLLKDWPKVASTTKAYSPAAVVSFAQFAFPQARAALVQQVEGQMKVALLLSVAYATALFFLGVEPFILLGLMSGLASFVPFLGIIVAFLVALVVALGQGLGVLPILLLCTLYFVGSSVESNFLTPRIVGCKVGVHPVWIFFTVFAVLATFGVGGAFFIMPIATTCGSLIHSMVAWLKKRETPSAEPV